MIMHENRFAQVTRVLPYSESRLKALPLLEQRRSWPALWTLSSWAAERSAWSQLLRACLSSSIFVSFSPNHFQPISALPLLKLTWHPTCCYFLKNRPITNLAWRRLLLSNPNHYLWISWWKFVWIARGKELNSIVKRLPLLQSDSLGDTAFQKTCYDTILHHFPPCDHWFVEQHQFNVNILTWKKNGIFWLNLINNFCRGLRRRRSHAGAGNLQVPEAIYLFI